jgi:predicted alpha-1,2-mannosidase
MMHRRSLLVTFFTLCSIITFSQNNKRLPLTQYVNPLIGTEKMGHTFPGATVPFGMVQLSPDTDTLQYELNGKYNPDIYKYCAGYQYTDKTIVGFSHTHFSGTGHSDLGDILIMPTTGELQLNPGTSDNPAGGFRSAFSHSTELAQPDYYKVKLDDNNILAELTASARVGMHQYTFPASDKSHIIVDLISGIYNYENKNVWTFVRVENDSLITGYRQTNGWARTRTVYFAIAFSKPFKSYGYKNFAARQVYRGFWGRFDQSRNFAEMAGTQLRAYFDFDTKEAEQIKLKVALSPVSTEGALLNMRTEIPHWDFEKVKADGQKLWNDALNKVEVETITEGEKINFYTAMYHSFLSPSLYMDADGKYRGLDQNVHTAEKFENYTTFSLWDTYRALHPLFNILQPERNRNMISSMLAHYSQSVHHMLPVWSHYANENWCMIGYHSVAVIADAVVKGNAGFDLQLALDGCVTTARNRQYDGLQYYMEKGYVPEDKNGSSVSKTLEYAYDDWSIAQMAKKLNRMDIYDEFIKRSQNYKNVYDASVGYMRPRLNDGSFMKDFDVLSTNQRGYIEGNSWNYSLYVPQNPDTLISMMGGKKRFVKHLDSLFTFDLPDKYFAETEDITKDGIIGNYVHGNEPSHHVAYLFNWTEQPWKTQEKIRMILPRMYKPATDGLGGNDDCGQMSAWYIFSSLGFYPVAPGSDEYSIGSPSVKSALLQLENGKTFSIEAVNQSDKNVYIQKIMLNNVAINRSYLKHAEIMDGGKLVFVMGAAPNKKLFSK